MRDVLPALSLVICTRDRADRLSRTLAHVERIRSDSDWEVVLVDNGSRDGTLAVLAEFAARSPVPAAVVSERRPGLANARNAGVAASRGTIVAFIDDDCYPSSDIVDAWLAVFGRAGVGYGAGRILLHDSADAPVTIRADTHEWLIPAGAYVKPGLVQGANMAFRRSVLELVGGFDPDLGPGAAFNFEDVDIAARASAMGVAGGYFPGPTVRHHHGRRPGPALDALLQSYDHGRGAYWGSLLLRNRFRRYAFRNLAVSLVRKRMPQVRREWSGFADYLAHRLRGSAAPRPAGLRRVVRKLRGKGEHHEHEQPGDDERHANPQVVEGEAGEKG